MKEIQLNVVVDSREKIESVIERIKTEVAQVANIKIKDDQATRHIIEMAIMVHQRENPTELYKKLSRIEDNDLIELIS